MSDPGRFHEPDPVTGQLISYTIVPLDASPTSSRVKRQSSSSSAIPEEGNDKSALSKVPVATKKPTVVNIKESVNVSITSTTSSSNPKNKPESPATGISVPVTPSPTVSANPNDTSNTNRDSSSTSFKITTMKSLVVDVVPTKVSPTMKSFPGPKIGTKATPSNSTTMINGTSPANNASAVLDKPDTTQESLPPFPEFPPDLTKTYNVTNKVGKSSLFVFTISK